MSHKSALCLIENAVQAIQDDVQFSYGLTSAFNHSEKKSFTFVNLDPMNATAAYADNNTQNYSKTWQVEMSFMRYDKKDNYDKAKHLNITDALVDRFLNNLNQNDNIVITGMVQTPFIEALSAIVTGHTLTFSLTLNDDIDYCHCE